MGLVVFAMFIFQCRHATGKWTCATPAHVIAKQAQKEAEGELLTSPRRAGGGQPTGGQAKRWM